MRYVTLALCLALWATSAHAVDQPKPNHDRPSYPVLTMRGLEDLQLGQVPPAASSVEGLTFQPVQERDWQAGRAVVRTSLKLYYQGFYLGRASLDSQGRIAELELVDWRVTFSGAFAPGSSWSHLRSQRPAIGLHYAYEMDAIVAEDEALPGLQIHFDPSAYRQPSALQGEFTPLDPAGLAPNARATHLRLFWIPPE